MFIRSLYLYKRVFIYTIVCMVVYMGVYTEIIRSLYGAYTELIRSLYGAHTELIRSLNGVCTVVCSSFLGY